MSGGVSFEFYQILARELQMYFGDKGEKLQDFLHVLLELGS